MPSDDVLDFGKLLSRISDDEPAGRNLREPGPGSESFDELVAAQTSARRLDRDVLNSGELPRDPNQDWGRVLEGAQSILATASKDLQITAWLIEALLRFHGFAGLRDGLKLARLLTERYWDQLYPLPDEGRYEARVAHFYGLNGTEGRDGTLLFPIRLVGLTTGSPPVTLFDYAESADADDVCAAVQGAPEEHLRNLRADVRLAGEELEQLYAAFRERCADETPPVGNIREALQHAAEIVRGATSHLPDTDHGDDGDHGDGDDAKGVSAAASETGGSFRSRSQALDTIDRLAKYFRQTDEHSFVSYHLERAARWGRTPLPQLLEELIKDESEREKVFRYIGIPSRSAGGDGD